MERIHDRLRLELERLQTSAADAARAAGEENSQGLRDVLSGRKRLSAELLAALVSGINIDALFVLTGKRQAVPVLTADESFLLERYRASAAALRDAALRVLLIGDLGTPNISQTVQGKKAQQFNAPVSSVTGAVITGKSRRAR